MPNITLTDGTIKVGVDENDSTFVQIDSDSVDIIEDVGGSNSTVASFGVTTTVGITGNNQYVNIDGDGVKVYGGSATTFAQVDADSFNIISGGHTSASFGATTTIGPTSGSHVLINSEQIAIKRGTTTFLSASAAGLEMQGTVKATAGEIGGFLIGTNAISSSGTPKRGLILEPGESIRGYGSTVHKTVTSAGVFSFGFAAVAESAGGGSGERKD